MSEDEKCRIRQIRAYTNRHVNDLEDEIHNDFIGRLISGAMEAIEDAINHDMPKSHKTTVKEYE